MNKYIGTKLIEAEKATLAEAQALKTGACDTIEEARERCVRSVLYAGSGESETDIWRINRRTHGE